MKDDRAIAKIAREAVRSGKLPSRAPDHTWGGPGSGALCGICGVSIGEEETELEIEFSRDAEGRLLDKHQLHVACFAAWERERRECAADVTLPAPAAVDSAISGAGNAVLGAGNAISVPARRRRFLSDAAGDGKISGGEQTNHRRGLE
jgi:hypothetical protein